MLFGKKRKAYKKFREATLLMEQWGTIRRKTQAHNMMRLGKETDAMRMMNQAQEEFARAMRQCNVSDAELEYIRQNMDAFTDKLHKELDNKQ